MLGALARDWEVSGVVTLQSGIPLAVTQVTNFNSFAGFGTQRPNRIADPNFAQVATINRISSLTRRLSRWRRSSHWETALAILVRGPHYRNF